MSVGTQRWREIEELYHAAVERERGGQAALLEGADPDVRREVESLLAQDIRDLPLSEPALRVRRADPSIALLRRVGRTSGIRRHRSPR